MGDGLRDFLAQVGGVPPMPPPMRPPRMGCEDDDDDTDDDTDDHKVAPRKAPANKAPPAKKSGLETSCNG